MPNRERPEQPACLLHQAPSDICAQVRLSCWQQAPCAILCGLRLTHAFFSPPCRTREMPEGQELKFLTPVRRSLRIERVGSRYPEMLRDHDPVVSSLSEILDDDEETQFFFRMNKALPEVAEMEVLRL